MKHMEQKIKFYNNGQDQGIAFENIDFKDKTYNMAVCIY